MNDTAEYVEDTRPWNSPERQRDYLAEYIKPSTVIYTRLAPGSGETDYIEVYIAPRRGSIREITWEVGRATGLGCREIRGRHGIPMAGGFYNKALEVYIALRHALGQDEDQRRWQTL